MDEGKHHKGSGIEYDPDNKKVPLLQPQVFGANDHQLINASEQAFEEEKKDDRLFHQNAALLMAPPPPMFEYKSTDDKPKYIGKVMDLGAPMVVND